MLHLYGTLNDGSVEVADTEVVLQKQERPPSIGKLPKQQRAGGNL